ncbi:MAG: isochorismatase family protein [Alphaproteobacteria bacterium]|nr:isochorismatase family protein [Alphaproteobacteria bacterium]
MTPRFPAVHCAIDVQDRFIRDLFPERRKYFPAAIRVFADALKEIGIPTIWVVWNRQGEFEFYTHLLHSWDSLPTLLPSLSLRQSLVRADEDIYTRGHDNAFHWPFLGNVIRQQYNANTVLITGMNSSVCVAKSAAGAIGENLGCYVIYDLLADSSEDHHEKFSGGDPLFHKELVGNALGNAFIRNAPHLEFVQSRTFLNSFCDAPELSPFNGGRGRYSMTFGL